jgi:hypothetical protein
MTITFIWYQNCLLKTTLNQPPIFNQYQRSSISIWLKSILFECDFDVTLWFTILYYILLIATCFEHFWFNRNIFIFWTLNYKYLIEFLWCWDKFIPQLSVNTENTSLGNTPFNRPNGEVAWTIADVLGLNPE